MPDLVPYSLQLFQVTSWEQNHKAKSFSMVLILRSSESLITINIPLLPSAVLVLQGGNMIPILHMEQKFRTFQTEKSEL